MSSRKSVSVVTVLAVVLLIVSGCTLFDGLLGGKKQTLPLGASLWYKGQQYTSVTAHPLDSDGGLVVTVKLEDECYTDWDDGSPVESVNREASHAYTRKGTFAIECWAEDGNTRYESKFSVVSTNEKPTIGKTLLYQDALHTGDAIACWLTPHIGGCNADGSYLYSGGIIDPDGDEMRKRITVNEVQEKLVDGVLARLEVVKKYSVFSLHDRSNITGRWVDVWGFWLAVGWTGQIPPYSFGMVPYESLAPRLVLDPLFLPQGLFVKGWDFPVWPDPGCPDCDGDDDDEITDPSPEETDGETYVRITVESIDRWGGYYGLRWRYDVSGKTCSTGAVLINPK